MKRSIIISLIAAILLSGCSSIFNQVSWSTNQIDEFGISFEMPENWEQTTTDEIILIASSESALEEQNYSDAAGASITPVSLNDFSGIDDPIEILNLFRDHFERSGNDVQLLVEPTHLTINDQAASYMQYQGTVNETVGLFGVLVIIKDESVILVFTVDGTDSNNSQNTLQRITNSISINP